MLAGLFGQCAKAWPHTLQRIFTYSEVLPSQTEYAGLEEYECMQNDMMYMLGCLC